MEKLQKKADLIEQWLAENQPKIGAAGREKQSNITDNDSATMMTSHSAALGAPSRTHIKKYHDFMAEVEETADSINWRFQTREWKPILFLKAHHSHEEIYPFYKAADVCMVTSLHDGMNLVAKEFISARDDEEGVLILSQFTGAPRELTDALIINPYDIEEMADALHRSLVMEPQEKSERMGRMRGMIRENNIYRWAGDLIAALARLRSSDSAELNRDS